MAIHFKKSSAFEVVRSKIEQHLFDSVFQIENDLESALRSVEQFDSALERLLDTLEAMYKSPATKDMIGVKSFPIRDGRYRVFFKTALKPLGTPLQLYLLKGVEVSRRAHKTLGLTNY